MTMNVKTLIKQAVDAQIQGNKQSFADTMKQVLATKVQKMVSETHGSWKPSNIEQTGSDTFHFDEVELENGELVEVDVTVTDYYAATPGNYSPVAGDPSEYYGDPEEFELQIDRVQPFDEDGNPLTPVTGDQAKAMIPEEAYKYMWNKVSDFIKNQEPDFDEPY